MPRGGKRSGTPGAYPNRSDLNSSIKPTAAKGQGYGVAGQQLAAQKQLPMAPPSLASGMMPPGGPPPPAGVAPSGSFPTPDQTGAPSPFAPPAAVPPQPGEAGPLNRPSDFPGQPVTHGAPVGAGAGPEALQQMPSQGGPISTTFAQLAAMTNSPALQQLAQQAQALGQ